MHSGLDARADHDLPPPPHRRSAATVELHQRLDRMADGHPSSPRYTASDQLRHPDNPEADRRADATTPTRDDGAGWQAPEVRSHPDLPAVPDIRLTYDRACHILDGDGPGTPGGGHRHGTGRAGKTEFPANWPDDKIVSTIQDVTRAPDEVHWQEFNGRWRVTADREGVLVTAVVLPDGRIWSAWPEPGGPGVIENPRT